MSGKSLKLPKMSLFSKKKTNNFLLDHMIELLLIVIIIALPLWSRPSCDPATFSTCCATRP